MVELIGSFPKLSYSWFAPHLFPHIMSREKANARERRRQKMIGNAFILLRNHLPKQLRDRKPSKAETLKGAAQYISWLIRKLGRVAENSSIQQQRVFNYQLNVKTVTLNEY